MFNKIPEDDKNYLVSWYDTGDMEYQSWHRAYYYDGKFFSNESMHSFPLKVDIWVEMPELPKLVRIKKDI